MTPPRHALAAPTEHAAFDLDRLLHPEPLAHGFARRPVPPEVVEELRALMACGPGMTDASATRLLVLTTQMDKVRLAAGLPNIERDVALRAPAFVLIAYDREFAEQMLAFASDGLDGRPGLDTPARLQAAVLRGGLLQGAYLAVSARALGLEADFFPVFDTETVTRAFFDEPGLEAIFVAALGFPGDVAP
jgi:3-hydroxypropanoate dehydrogenase